MCDHLPACHWITSTAHPPRCCAASCSSSLAQIIFGTLAERGRVCGKPTCHCARGAKHPAVQLAHWAGDGKTHSTHVPSAVVDTVRAGVEAWHRFHAVARELAERNRLQVWTRARREGRIR